MKNFVPNLYRSRFEVKGQCDVNFQSFTLDDVNKNEVLLAVVKDVCPFSLIQIALFK